MTTRTEHAINWFFTFGFFGVAAFATHLAYKLFLAERFLSGFGMMGTALIAILFGIVYLRAILVLRLAERVMREIKKEEEGK